MMCQVYKDVLSATYRSNPSVDSVASFLPTVCLLSAICAASTSHYCIAKKGYGFGRLVFTWGFSTMMAGLAHEVGYAARLVAPPTGAASNSVFTVILSACIIGLEVGGGWVGVQLGNRLRGMALHK